MEIAEAHSPTAKFHKLLVQLAEVKYKYSLPFPLTNTARSWTGELNSIKNPEKLDLVVVAEGTLGGQISSNSLGGVQSIWFLMYALYGVPAVPPSRAPFTSANFSTLVFQLSTDFLSPNLCAMSFSLFKNT